MDSVSVKKAIIIIEDDELIAELVKDSLNSEPDYQAIAMHDGALALNVIQSVKVDLILLDVRLPGLDGIQIYDILRADPLTSGVPVIFMTASTNDPDFKARSFENVIPKPFDLNTLLASVAAILRGKEGADKGDLA